MRRVLLVLAGVTAGVVAGAAGTMALQRTTPHPYPSPAPVAGAVVVTPRPVAMQPAEGILLVWTPGHLPAGIEFAVTAHPGVEHLTIVRAGLADLVAATSAEGARAPRPPAGMAIPLDVMAFDRHTYPPVLPPSARPPFAALRPGEALLGSTSAHVRQLGPGATIELASGHELTVAGVVDDTLVGAAEVVVTIETGASIGVTEDRYALVSYRSGRPAVEHAIRAAVPADVAVRIRGAGETPFLRHGDAVLPQALVKARFGEFAYRLRDGGEPVLDAAWESERLVTTELPIVGRARCHRDLLAALTGALRELEERGLSGLVDPSGFGGCWNPRRTATGDAWSRHAWGAAVDLNATKNPTGLSSVQDPRLVETMERWGFAWGGTWLVPDPAHFEYRRPPLAP